MVWSALQVGSFDGFKHDFLLFFQEDLMTNRGWITYCVSFLQLLQLLYQLVLPFGSSQKRRQEDIRFPPPTLYSTM